MPHNFKYIMEMVITSFNDLKSLSHIEDFNTRLPRGISNGGGGIMTAADSTLFSNNDLTEPGYSGQVVAISRSDQNYIPTKLKNKRRLFINREVEEKIFMWVDEEGYYYLFSDLRDIVIINQGVK